MLSRLSCIVFLLICLPPFAVGANDLSCDASAAACHIGKSVFRLQAGNSDHSAVHLGNGAFVTSRHIVLAGTGVTLVGPDGTRHAGRIVPSSYRGDLILIEGPAIGQAIGAQSGSGPVEAGTGVRVVGFDRDAGRITVSRSGKVLLPVPGDKPLARIQHDAPGTAGNSGGLLVTESGVPLGIVTAGADRLGEAIPVAELETLRQRSGESHAGHHAVISQAYRDCTQGLRHVPARRGRLPQRLVEHLTRHCTATANRQLISAAGEALGRAGYLGEARELFAAALDADPFSLEARQSLVVVLQLGGRHAEAIPHIRWLMGVLEADAGILRLAIQAGKLSGDGGLAEEAYERLSRTHPTLALQMRRFLDSPLPPGYLQK